MKAARELILPGTVAVAPVAALPPQARLALEHEPGDFLVTPGGAASLVVDADTAALLECFRSPATVVDALLTYCRARALDPVRMLDQALPVLAELVEAGALVDADRSLAPASGGARRPWRAYRYYDVYHKQFSADECRAIVALHEGTDMMTSRMDYPSGEPVRDCNLFWLPRNEHTGWIYARLWQVAARFNQAYQLALSPAREMGMAQLTRYTPGQQYNWHMDLGPGQASLRKISLVLQLSANQDMRGGGLEIFLGDSTDNHVAADLGDVVVFPSFVMHRAAMVTAGLRWSLVLWLNGPEPVR